MMTDFLGALPLKTTANIVLSTSKHNFLGFESEYIQIGSSCPVVLEKCPL